MHLIFSGQPFRLAGPAQLPFGSEGLPLWGQVLMLLAIFILGFDGLGEELGWRGPNPVYNIHQNYPFLATSVIAKPVLFGG